MWVNVNHTISLKTVHYPSVIFSMRLIKLFIGNKFICSIKIIITFNYLMLHNNTMVFGDSSNWLEIFLHRFSSEIEANQLRIFQNTSGIVKIEKYSKLTQTLTQKFSSIKINLSFLPSIKNGTFSETNYFLNTGPVIFIHHQHFGQLYNQLVDFLNFYNESYPIHTRPKGLVIYDRKLNLSDSDSVEKLLKYAWIKKFLDISFLEVSVNKNKANIYTYNPFFKKLSRSLLTMNSKLFPNKLCNMNKYPFTTPIFHHPPYLTLGKDADGKLKILSGHNYKVLGMVLMQMNFYHLPVEVNLAIDLEKQLISNENLNMYTIPHTALKSYWAPLLILHDDCIPFVGIIVPQPIFKFNISLELIIFFIYFPIILICLKCLIIIFQWKIFYFDMLDVLLIIFGMPLLSFPKNFFRRIIVVIMFFTSMLFSIDFITYMVNNIVVYDEVKFNSFEEIMKSDYKLAMNNVVRRIIFNPENGYNLDFLKAKVIQENIACPSSAMTTEKIICVLSMLRAKEVLKNSVHNGRKIYKMISVNFACNVAGYPFERASPFKVQFETIFLRMYESGIYNWILKENKILDASDDQGRKEIIDNLFLTNILLLLVLGYLIASIVFMTEIFYKACKKN